MTFDTSQCTARPQTAAGKAYLQVVLDPCTENLPKDFHGIPDGSPIDKVLPHMRDDLILSPPDDLGTDELWNIILFDTPYLVYEGIFVRYLASGPAPSALQIRMTLNGMRRTEVNEATYPQWYRPVRYMEPDTSDLNYPTVRLIITTSQFEVSFFRPAVLSNFNSSPTALGWREIRKYRCAAKGRTIHLNAPATGTQGRVVTGQLGTESSVKTLVQSPSSAAPVAVPWPCRFSVSPPFDFNILAQQDLNARQDIIKPGSYDMQRHWNDSVSWNEVEDVRPIFRAEANNLVGTFVGPPTFINENGHESSFGELLKYDGFDQNLGWVITHISGMSKLATIHIKYRAYWEFNVPGNTSWSGMKKAPCILDLDALEAEKQLGASIPHSFEAIYNDRGLLADILRPLVAIGKQVVEKRAPGVSKKLSQTFAMLRDIDRHTMISDAYSGPGGYGSGGFVGPNGRRNNRKK
jgi:hypothetical protein